MQKTFVVQRQEGESQVLQGRKITLVHRLKVALSLTYDDDLQHMGKLSRIGRLKSSRLE